MQVPLWHSGSLSAVGPACARLWPLLQENIGIISDLSTG